MWSNNNFGSNSAPTHNGAQDNNNNNDQSNTNEENYQGSDINQGGGNFVNYPHHTAGFPVYPLFPFEYYPPPNSNYIGNYMPNVFHPMPGFGNNEFIQAYFTNPANPEQAQAMEPVALAHPGVSTQSVPATRPIKSARPDTPTEPAALRKPVANMALNSRAEELKSQLIKSKEERAKAKNALKADEAVTGALDPTSQEMASLLRGSPTMPRNQSKGPMSGSIVSSTSPKNIARGIIPGNTGPRLARKTSACEILGRPKADDNEVTKLIEAGRVAAEDNYKKHLSSNALPASSIGPSPDAARVVQNNVQSKGSQTQLNLMHSKPASTQARAFQDIEQKRTVPNEQQEKVQTEELVQEAVGKEKSPSTPSVVERQGLIRFQSSTITRDKKPAPRHEYIEQRGSSANTIDKPRLYSCDKDKDNSNAKNSTNTIPSPKEDKHSPLEKVLLSNDELRDWLKLTKWDDLAHRRSALGRHRAITAIDTEKATEKAHLLESAAKIEALDKEKAKLEAQTTDDEDGFGGRFPGHSKTRSTARGGSYKGSVSSLDQATKPTPASVNPRKRSFSTFSSANHLPVRPNSRRYHASDVQRSSPGNSGKELFHDRHEHRGRSRERRSYEDRRNMSPSLRSFLEREDAREARETAARRHNAGFRGYNREGNRPYRDYRSRPRPR
ncbi:hypothetical protein VC83_00184 [Pseudogymnoascus destructans]|nr:uncharacterized protein VC83_00184 [Pseudogymnoascus destructans]OAF63197.1 hypothetical protein VC83_00184 [Pseudogymnoascus destructans]